MEVLTCCLPPAADTQDMMQAGVSVSGSDGCSKLELLGIFAHAHVLNTVLNLKFVLYVFDKLLNIRLSLRRFI